MARPLRLEFSGALYHVTARGNRQEAIFDQEDDFVTFLSVLGEVCKRYNWIIHAYCLMLNHYHLLIETPDANLSKGMRQLNGVYTQKFNRTHARVGHVFQGRYKAILVEKESHLLELSRYIVLNPVRARLVRSVAGWPWSSYRATTGQTKKADWLHTKWLLANFGRTKGQAIEDYKKFIRQGKDQPSPWEHLKHQVYLGGSSFVEKMVSKIELEKDLSETPVHQRRPIAKPLDYYEQQYSTRDDAICAAYATGAYSMKEIGEHFGLHYSRVSRIVNNAKSKT